MLYITFPLAALIELLAPIALAVWLMRRLPGQPGRGKAGWALVGVGVLTFIGSQVVHLPLNWGLGKIELITNDKATLLRTAIVLGLSSGLCEETARAVGYWLLKRRARTWKAALTLGAGHGGIESIFIGGLVLLTFVNMLVVRNMDLSALGLSGEQLALAQKQVSDYWSMPWHMPFTGAVERLMAIALHLSLSVLVLQAFTRRNALYYVGAVGWHASVNAVAVILLMNEWSAWAIEAALVVGALISLGLILAFRRSPYDVPPEGDGEPEPSPAPLLDLDKLELSTDPETLREQIERSRFET